MSFVSHWMSPSISMPSRIQTYTTIVSVLSDYTPAESALQRLREFGVLAVLNPKHEIELWQKAAQLRILNEIGRLDANWDGYGAPKVSADTVRGARELLDKLERQSALPNAIVPTTSSTIAFEWESPLGGAYLEIGASTFGFYTSPLVGEPIMLGGKVDELDAGEMARALATVVSSTLPDSLANGDMAVGF